MPNFTCFILLVICVVAGSCSSSHESPHKGGTLHFSDFTEVRAYRLNWDDEYSFAKIITNVGKLNSTRIPTEGILLTAAQVETLEAAVTGTHPEHPVAACFYPHHAFVFYDASGTVVGHIDICFLCANYGGQPRGFADSWDLDGLRGLVGQLGMPIVNKDWD